MERCFCPTFFDVVADFLHILKPAFEVCVQAFVYDRVVDCKRLIVINVRHARSSHAPVCFPGCIPLRQFQVAGHLCPCGCNEKVITPLGDIGWQYYKRKGKASLYPSLGNWELTCRSHYWIINARVEWSGLWTSEEVQQARESEKKALEKYFRKRSKRSLSQKLFRDMLNIFS